MATRSPTATRHRRRVLRIAVLSIVGFVTIGWALVLALAGLALPWVASHPDRIAAELSQRLGRPVGFDRLDARWEPTGPVFALAGVRIGEGESAFSVPQAEWVLDFYAWLRRGVSFSEFRLGGLDLELVREAEGTWRVRGLGAGPAPVDLDLVLDLTAVTIEHATVRVLDAGRGIDWQLARLDARVRNEAGGRLVGASAWPSEGGPPLRVACLQAAHAEPYRCFARGDDLEVGEWLDGLRGLGLTASAGRADLRAWFDVGSRIDAVRVRASARRLALRALEPAGLSDGGEAWAWIARERLEVDARFERGGDGWRLDWIDWSGRDDADPDTRFTWTRAVRGAEVEDHVLASRVDLGLAGALAAMAGADARLRGALIEARPRGRLSDLELRRRGDGPLALAARVEDLVIDPGARTPGLGPVSGVLLADADGAALALAAGSALTFAYPHVFRESIRARVVSGNLAAWRGDDGAWRLGASELALDGEGWSATLAGEFAAGTEARPPLLDVRADVHAGRVERARLFWPVNVMPPDTVRWLDRGLVGGDVRSGAAVFRGELRRQSLRDGGARLEAVATVRDAVLDYAPGWPMASLERASLRFIDNGMWIDEVSGVVRGLRVADAAASIDDFADARLVVDVRHGAGDGPDLLGFLRDSPLEQRLGAALHGVELGGRGELALRLELPLKPGEIGMLDLAGEVRLADATLADRARELDFGTTSGRVRFSERGIVTDDLSVRFGGEPATFALAVGEFVADPRHVAEASVRGELPAAALLARFPGAADIAQRLPGRAQWDLLLAVARDEADGPSGRAAAQRLSVRSDLVGIALDLPAPLRKDAASALPFRLDLALDGPREARIDLGRIARARARWPESGDGASVALALGMADVPELPERGIVIRGDVAALDADGWLDVATRLPAAGAGTTPLVLDIDLDASELALIGRAFPETRIVVAREQSRSEIRFEGPSIVGFARLPEPTATARRVTLDFDRLHLQDRVPGVHAEPTDPATLPALLIEARDFRLGDARLGAIAIETRPIEGGLSVERLSATSPELSVTGSGRWIGVGAAARSDFEVELTATSLGRMLDALGFVGIVDGGETRARMSGRWPGGPADLKLARFDGELEARVARGRILEVEPGAGRILGLVSLTEIPRRLALDFSDFFQRGMAFDSIEGRFRLEAGDAWTDAIAIASPGADIVISGRTGLAARDYDQRLVVTPRVGSVLPIVGALAAGPAGAAFGAVAQGVLGPGIGRIATANYKVTGSWDSPEIVPQRATRDGQPRS
jgi:uncharacterized protein (TIGR02099 family)